MAGESKTIFLALDIETTGQYYASDVCFAIAYCYGTSEKDIIKEGRWAVDLKHLVPGDSWKERWEKVGWEERCFAEFWSKPENIELLDRLCEEAKCSGEAEMFDLLDGLLLEIERDFENEKGYELKLILDTVHYDASWINIRLQQFGHSNLVTKRDGTGYRAGYEVNSYRLGMAQLHPEDNRHTTKDALDSLKSNLLLFPSQHGPMIVDAHNMYVSFLAAAERSEWERCYDEFTSKIQQILDHPPGFCAFQIRSQSSDIMFEDLDGQLCVVSACLSTNRVTATNKKKHVLTYPLADYQEALCYIEELVSQSSA